MFFHPIFNFQLMLYIMRLFLLFYHLFVTLGPDQIPVGPFSLTFEQSSLSNLFFN